MSYPVVTPYLIVYDAEKLIDFLQRSFDFSQVACHRHTDGKIMHAELSLGASMIMLGDASDEYPATSSMVHLFLPACDSFYLWALEAGASSIREPQDQEYGHRTAGVRDYAGNQWWIACKISGFRKG